MAELKINVVKLPQKDMYNSGEFHTGQIEVQCSKLGSKRNTVTYKNIYV